MTKRKSDAYARLVEHADNLIRTFQAGESSLALNAKTRRLIRALLVERATDACVAAADQCDRYYAAGLNRRTIFWDESRAVVHAAVLRRPHAR